MFHKKTQISAAGRPDAASFITGGDFKMADFEIATLDLREKHRPPACKKRPPVVSLG
ncbi:MAG: hypothetical protein LBP23_00670 [Treponema sp.]|jgi:hypothetical protein|nr:hypothetical protein [Treponema sp.]